MEEKQIYELIEEANELLDRAYVPYSNFPVAAILIDDKGNKYRGTNIENASFPLSLCAERNAITTAKTEGMSKIKILVVTAKKVHKPISPCGACRQVISEFSDDDTMIILANANNKEYRICSIKDLLPYNFSNEDL